MDNIIIEKIWADDDIKEYFMIRVTASNARTTMSAEVYAFRQSILDILRGAKGVLVCPFTYVLGDANEDYYLDYIEFDFRINNRGIVLITFL